MTDNSSTGDLLTYVAADVNEIVKSIDSLIINLGERSSQIQSDHREWLGWDPDPRTATVGDARNAYIERLQAVVYSARLSNILIRDHLVDPEWWTPERWGQTPLFSKRPPGDPDWIIRSIHTVSVQAKNALIGNTFSLTETFLRDIFRADQIRYGKKTPSFPKMYRRILGDAYEVAGGPWQAQGEPQDAETFNHYEAHRPRADSRGWRGGLRPRG